MTGFKHPVYPTIMFDATDESLFLSVDGDVRHMFDGEEVGRLLALVDVAADAEGDLQEFFAGLDEPEWVAAAAAELFIISAAEIGKLTIR